MTLEEEVAPAGGVVPELVHRGSSVSGPDQACGHWPLASPDQQLQLLLQVKQQRSKKQQ